MTSFDPDFNSPREIADFYRRKGLQPIPAKGKRPAVEWKAYQNAPISQEVFEGWYNEKNGTHRANGDIGTLLGKASGNKLMTDLDIYKPGGEAANNWYLGILAVHNNGLELETWEQVTGGGGRQLFFECPVGWTPPNVTTDIFVDIKGQGGFAVLPPSRHSSGRLYKWREGRSPDDIPIMVAPQWLCEEIERLAHEHGGARPSGARAGGNGKHDGAGGTYDDWGHRKDGREDYLTRFVWGAACDYRRAEGAFRPTLNEIEAKAKEKYAVYFGIVTSKVDGPPEDKERRLEAEGRGWTEFWVKWRRAIDQWDGKLRDEADKPPPKQEEPGPEAEPKVDPKTGEPLPLLQSAEQFLRGFVPPDYLIDKLIQKSYLYALTARTGHGKTAVAMLMASTVARGVPFHGYEVAPGRVLFLAGENAQDVRARYKVLADHEKFDPEAVPFYFVDGVIDIAVSMPKIIEEATKIGDLALIVVDTATAYFRGDDSNSNAQQGLFAQLLRRLIALPGNPAVLVNCHPVKNATADNLIPLGGSNFINEVDGNLTLWSEEKTCALNPHGAKWRGSPFEQLEFELRTATSDTVKDSKGRCMPSVVAVPITEAGAERRLQTAEADEDTVLKLIHGYKNSSFTELAKLAMFTLPDGRPYKSKVQRIVERLKASKLVFKYRGSKYRLTKKGCKIAGVKWEKDDDDD